MTSTDINYVLVKDERLISNDTINFAVMQGAQDCTTTEFNASTQSNISHQFTVQVPSLETVVDRMVYWSSECVLKFTLNPDLVAANIKWNAVNMSYGETDALSPFPLTQLCNTMSAQLNNNTITTNIRDILPVILRTNSPTAFNVYDDSCPLLFDSYLNYEDQLGAVGNVLGSYNNNVHGLDVKGRGSFPVEFYSDANLTTPVVWSDSAGNATNFYCKFTSCEPLVGLSPFLFGNPKSNNTGLYGLNNMIFQFTIGDASRVWRKAPVDLAGAQLTFADKANSLPFTVSIEKFDKSKLIFQFLSPKPSQLLPSKCKVPFYTLDRYITNKGADFKMASGGNIYTQNPSFTINSDSLTLSTIPDRLFIFVRKINNADTSMIESDSFMVIDNISLNFANSAGLLSNSNINSLYKFSKESSSNQSFDEFNGKGSKYIAGASGGSQIPMSGSLVMLQFGRHIALSSDYYAPSSIGNFTLQMKVTARWQQTPNFKDSTRGAPAVARTAIRTAPIKGELVIVCQQSGIMSIERGVSSIDTGLCSKEIVLATVEKEPYSQADVNRMIGSGLVDNLKSMASNALRGLVSKLPSLARAGLEKAQFSHPVAEAARQASVGALKSLGYAKRNKLASRLK